MRLRADLTDLRLGFNICIVLKNVSAYLLSQPCSAYFQLQLGAAYFPCYLS